MQWNFKHNVKVCSDFWLSESYLIFDALYLWYTDRKSFICDLSKSDGISFKRDPIKEIISEWDLKVTHRLVKSVENKVYRLTWQWKTWLSLGRCCYLRDIVASEERANQKSQKRAVRIHQDYESRQCFLEQLSTWKEVKRDFSFVVDLLTHNQLKHLKA